MCASVMQVRWSFEYVAVGVSTYHRESYKCHIALYRVVAHQSLENTQSKVTKLICSSISVVLAEHDALASDGVFVPR